MQWNLERSVGAAALLAAVGMFLTTAAPMAAAEMGRQVTQTADPAAAAEEAQTLPFVQESAAAAEPEEAAQQAEPVLLRINLQELEVGTRLTLCGPGGTQGSVPVPSSGQLTLSMQPGSWSIIYDGNTAEFTLCENAAVVEAYGACWTDGESLTLSTSVRGTLRVEKTVASELDSVYIYRLSGTPADDNCRAIVFSPGSDLLQTCMFWGLPEGEYILWENDIQAAVFTVTAEARDHSVSLR